MFGLIAYFCYINRSHFIKSEPLTEKHEQHEQHNHPAKYVNVTFDVPIRKATTTPPPPPLPAPPKWEDNEEIQILREYLRIATVHPNPNYGKTMCFQSKIIFAECFKYCLTSTVFLQSPRLNFCKNKRLA